MVKYDYLMLKPESQKKFPEIYDKIQRSKLGSIKLYGVIVIKISKNYVILRENFIFI